MDLNEKLSVLTDAVTSLMDSNKALTDQVKQMQDNSTSEPTKPGKTVTAAELDDIMKHL